MTTITVAGPFDEAAARQTARALGESNHSVYSTSIKDADGYDTGERQWFVERDNSIVPDLICGMTWTTIQRMQGGANPVRDQQHGHRRNQAV